ncbi:hypothetical protein [Halobaculum marinum]|uniref:Uncharacterized protein n=1 Tax=Halobaculum marinum TaxID=3031996 RepID=A0ABD5X469_9EURY|nr:hypothetical protein [Halobaculum sp. DT55]
MSGFDFERDDPDARDDPEPGPTETDTTADSGVSFAADADTVVSPAEPVPLPDDLDPDATRSSPASAGDGPGGPVDDTLLYAGEEPQADLSVADGRLVATSHRVLAYAPDDDERATLRDVHRVNVREVRLSSTGTDWLVRPIAYCVLGGLAMVLGGSMVSFDAMSTTMPEGAGATGVGGLLSMIGGVLSVLALVDDLLRVGGALTLLVGAALLGVYAYTRGREVVVKTEGEADTLRVDAGDADGDAVERFRAKAELERASGGRLKQLFRR